MPLLQAISHRAAACFAFGSPLWHFEAYPSPPDKERQSKQT
jgi:hypothetical protein